MFTTNYNKRDKCHHLFVVIILCNCRINEQTFGAARRYLNELADTTTGTSCSSLFAFAARSHAISTPQARVQYGGTHPAPSQARTYGQLTNIFADKVYRA